MEWLSIVAVVVVGLMVGVEVSVAFVVNPIVDRLPANAGLLARADGGRMLGRVMPVWYFGSLLLTSGHGRVGARRRCGVERCWPAGCEHRHVNRASGAHQQPVQDVDP